MTEKELYELVNKLLSGVITTGDLRGKCSGGDIMQIKKILSTKEEEHFNLLKQNPTLEACDAFVKVFSQSNHKMEVESIHKELKRQEEDRKRTEDEAAKMWDSVKKNDEDALANFIRMFPASAFAGEANKTIINIRKERERAAWQRVDKNNIYALEDYVRANPSSPYLEDAKGLIRRCELKEIEERMAKDWAEIRRDLELYKVTDFLERYSAYGDSPIFTKAQRVEDYLKNGGGAGSHALEKRLENLTTRGLTPDQLLNQQVQLIQNWLEIDLINKDEFLEMLRSDKNLLRAAVIKNLIENKTLTLTDLRNIGIEEQFITRLMSDDYLVSFPPSGRIEAITRQSTEIYFWGIPSSGKTCALGAILSTAYNSDIADAMMMDTRSQGYGYMNRLINLFQSNRINTLVAGTEVTAFYEMGFDLIDKKGRVHPITCIDMAGELMRCMYKSMDGAELANYEEEMLETMTRILVDNRTNNRKIHFFVVEYGAENRMYEGLPQLTYLDGAMQYIQRGGLFKSQTDAVFVLITKADKCPGKNKAEFREKIAQYNGFFNGLEQICRRNEINGGRLEKYAFSLGDVCFQTYCRFKPEKGAVKIVSLMLERSASYRAGKRGFFGNLFRG